MARSARTRASRSGGRPLGHSKASWIALSKTLKNVKSLMRSDRIEGPKHINPRIKRVGKNWNQLTQEFQPGDIVKMIEVLQKTREQRENFTRYREEALRLPIELGFFVDSNGQRCEVVYDPLRNGYRWKNWTDGNSKWIGLTE